MAKIDWRKFKTGELAEQIPMSGPYKPSDSVRVKKEETVRSEPFPVSGPYRPAPYQPKEETTVDQIPLSGPYTPSPKPTVSIPKTDEPREQIPMFGPYVPQRETPISQDEREVEDEGERKQFPIFLSDKHRGISVSQDMDKSREALAYFGMSKSDRTKTKRILDPQKGIKFIQ